MSKKYKIRVNYRDSNQSSLIHWTDEEISANSQSDAINKVKAKYGTQFHSVSPGIKEIKEKSGNSTSSSSTSSTASLPGGKAGCFTIIIGILAVYYIFTTVKSFLFYWDNIFIPVNTISYEKENFTGKTSKISFKEETFLQVDIPLINKNGERKSVTIGVPLAKYLSDEKKKNIDGTKQIVAYELAPKYYEYMKYLKPKDVILPDSEAYHSFVKSEIKKYVSKNKSKFKEWNIDEKNTK
jgi:hypothetical protein